MGRCRDPLAVRVVEGAIQERLYQEGRMRASSLMVSEQLQILALMNQYHPAAIWIGSKPWDKVDRWQQLYDTVKLHEDMPHPKMKAIFLRKWFLQGIQAFIGNAGTAPPEQVGNILVFVGHTNMGKSWWFKHTLPVSMTAVGVPLQLGGRRMEESESIKEATSVAVAELGELDAIFRQTDMSAFKRKVTDVTDTGRIAWARHSV